MHFMIHTYNSDAHMMSYSIWRFSVGEYSNECSEHGDMDEARFMFCPVSLYIKTQNTNPQFEPQDKM